MRKKVRIIAVILALIFLVTSIISAALLASAADSATVTFTDEDGNTLDIDGEITLTADIDEEELQTESEELQAELEAIEDNAHGFFVWLASNEELSDTQKAEAQTAVDILEGNYAGTFKNGTDYTYADLLEAYSGTSLSELLSAISIIETGNAYREEILKISPVLCAISLLQSGYSEATEVFDVTENLFISATVYSDEKTLYDEYISGSEDVSTSDIENYLNLTNEEYEITGAGVQNGIYSQTFGTSSSDYGTAENAYSTDEFTSYIESFKEEIDEQTENLTSQIEAIQKQLELADTQYTATIANGEAVFEDIDTSISYTATVTATGYSAEDVSVTFTDKSATVILAEMDVSTIIGTVSDEEGEPISGVVVNLSGYTHGSATTDAEGTYSFTIYNDEEYTISFEVPEGYEDAPDITVSEDADYDVRLVLKTFTITTSAGEGGSITDTFTVSYGDSADVEITAAQGYRINTLTVGGAEIEGVNGESTYTYALDNITDDIEINAAFYRQTYTVTLSYNDYGTVVTDGGEVVYEYDTLTVTATPNEGYRTSNVTINDETTEYSENDYAYTGSIEISEDTTITVTFSLNAYTVLAEESEYGTASADKDTVDYGQDVTLSVVPNEGYNVESIVINDTARDYTYDEENECFTVTVEEVTEDISISVVYSEITTIDMDECMSITEADFVAGSVYYYRTSTACVITLIEGYTSEDTLEYSANTTIERITVFDGLKWYYVDVNITLIFDGEGPEITLDDYTSEWTNESVTVSGTVTDDNGVQKLILVYEDTEEEIEITDGAFEVTFAEEQNSTYELYATDISGNTSDIAEITIKIDKSSPEVSSIVFSDANIYSYGIFSDSDITVTVNATDSLSETDYYTLYADGEKIEDSTSGTFTITSENFNTQKEISFTVTDNAGNTSDYIYPADFSNGSNDVQVTDAEINITISPSAEYSNTDIVFDVSVSSDIPLNEIEIVLNEGEAEIVSFDEETYEYTAQITADEEGENILTVIAMAATNTQEQASSSAVIDITAPVITTFSIEESSLLETVINFLTFGVFYNDAITVTAEATDELSGVDKIELYEDDTLIDTQSGGNAVFEIDEEYLNTTLTVKATDKATNAAVSSAYVVIENDLPTITISRDEGEWFSEDVTFNVNITDNDSGINSVVITINGETIVSDDLSESQIFTKDYSVSTEGIGTDEGYSYVLSVTATDNSGNSKTSTDIVYVDTTAPYISSVKFDDEEDVTVTDYGFFFTNQTTVSISAADEISEVSSITYYLLPVDGEAGEEITVEGDEAVFVISANFKGQIYIKATDVAGNSGDYVTASGVIVENYENHSEETHIEFDYEEQDYYNSDVSVKVTVTDTYSGIANVEWSVTAIGDEENNQSGDGSDWTILSTDKNLTTSMEGTIVVSNDSNDILVTVTLTDNAGNTSEESITLNVDKTAPVISLSYDNNSVQNEIYYNGTRTLTITVDDDNFDSSLIVADGITLGEWTQTDGGYQTTVAFREDGEYSFSITVYDAAGNSTTVSDSFVIDTTPPEISVEFSPDNEGSYYAETRTAAITVTEENFADEDYDWIYEDGVYTATVTYDEDGEYQLSFTITDKAGNETSYESENFIIDTNAPTISGFNITLESAANTVLNFLTFGIFHNNTVDIEITATDGLSGIDYYTLYADDEEIGTSEDGTFTISESYFEGIISATATDKAGNTSEVTFPSTLNSNISDSLMIETVLPVITVSEIEDGWHTDNVDFNITVSDADSGLRSVLITINGETVTEENLYETQAFEETYTVSTEGVSSGDGSYTLSVTAIDNAGNASEAYGTTVYIDTEIPTITEFALEDETTSDFTSTDYGYFFNEDTTITVSASDTISGLSSITYKLVDIDGTTTEETLAVDENGQISFVVEANFKGQIYAKATDTAGNTSEYVYPESLIIENSALHEEEAEIEFFVDEEKECYDDDVDVTITVTDTYSGIAGIEWSVTAAYDTDENQSGTEEGWEVLATDENLTTSMQKTVTVSNDSDDIVVYVKMTDNAGNTSEDTYTLSIDKTSPAIEITYDNNDGDYYYDAVRTATITITERNFNESLLTVTGLGDLTWEETADENNPNNTYYTATVYFGEGEYSFAISLEDAAGNKAVSVSDEFIIDLTAPAVTVEYDNNDAANDFYYSASRTATITITETYFDESLVTITGGTASEWTSEGNVHTATVAYTEDGEYTFDITVEDPAGNIYDDYEEDSFVIDTEAPEVAAFSFTDASQNTLSKILNFLTFGIFYNDTVEVTVSAADTLSGIDCITLYADGKELETLSGEEVTFTVEADFEGTLSAAATDMAGNTSKITFPDTVNSDIADSSLMIETAAPTINVDYEESESGWYNGAVEFTITAGDTDSGLRNVTISINREELVNEDLYESETHEETYTVSTDSEGTFVLEVTVTDNAGNVSETYTATVYVDMTAAYITEFDIGEAAAEAVESTDYGYYFKEDTTVTITAKDAEPSSGLVSITYRLEDIDGTITEETLDVDENGQISFTVSADFKGQIYAKAADGVGNTSAYVSPEGLIVESEEQHESETHIGFSVDSVKDYYDDDVDVTITVTDTYSGIAGIEWSVTAAYDTDENQSGTEEGWEVLATDENLTTSMQKTVTVSNDSDDIVVYVKMTDNAGNTSEDTYTLNIDKTAPVISISYDNNDSDSEYSSYYDADRTATIKVEETNFDSNLVAASGITISSWEYSNGYYVTTVSFSEGSYSFSIYLKDKAGNKSNTIKDSFTIDETAPTVTVEYDNNSAANDFYYKKARTATITVVEANFDSSRVNIDLDWTTSGDTHTATIEYSEDAEYTFDITVTDMAGNVYGDYEEETFVVDTTKPTITDITITDENKSALNTILNFLTFGIFYNDTVKVTVTATDNLSGIDYITLYSNGEKLKKTSTSGTATFTVNEDYFEGEITAIATDKAGNNSKEKVLDTVMIEKVNPTVSITYEDGVDSWYADDVTFTIVAQDADSGLRNVTITLNGETLEDDDLYSSQVSKKTYTISTSEVSSDDGSYTLTVTATDNAGNVSDTYEEIVYIDTDSPYIYAFDFEGDTESPIETTDYGFYFKEDTTVTITAKDVSPSAGITSITYYLKSSDGTSTSAITEDIDSNGQISFVVEANFKGQIYAKATDNVNNSGDYVTASGVIVENYEKHSEETHIEFDYEISDYYDSDVSVTITVTDTYSGIAEIEWSVTAAYDTAKNQSGTENDFSEVSTDENLITVMEKTITVSNDSNDIEVEVKMTDNSGNSSTESIILNIDKTSPVIEISYDNNNPDEEYTDYYDADRTITVKITERNFDSSLVSAEGLSLSDWTEHKNSSDPDSTYYTATATLTEGVHSIKISFKDMASNSSNTIEDSFTIDKTHPAVTVTYNNNDAQNSNYYKASRTATITITETNFDASRITIADGTLSSWTNNGDTHTATISYTKDGTYTFDITITDKAGNTYDSYKAETFVIDRTYPTISISYDNSSAENGDYYKASRTATITIIELNFNSSDVVISGNYGSVSSWKSNGDVNTATITFNTDDDYSYTLSVTDKAGNTTDYGKTEEFTVDMTVPTISVSYDTGSSLPAISNETHTATITITEHNFDASSFSASIVNGEGTAPSVSSWTSNGDKHTATIVFSAEGIYTFTLNYTDMAGNSAAVYTADEFIIDLTEPEITFFDIEDQTAYRGEVSPGFVCTDDNYDSNGITITLTGYYHEEQTISATVSSILGGQSFKISDFEHTEDVDDIYTLTVTATDQAGNTTTTSITFSVNRYGSNFILSDETEDFVDSYYHKDEENITVIEINVDEIEEAEIMVTCDDVVTYLSRNAYEVEENSSGWQIYTYTLYADNFEEEGIYDVTITSTDIAGNIQNNKSKNCPVNFVIDKTAPTAVITGIEDGNIYNLSERTFAVNISDNIALYSVILYVNDSAVATYIGDELSDIDNKLSYTLVNNNDWYTVSAIVTDAAGNEYQTDEISVLVSTSLINRIVKSSWFIWALIIFLLILILIIFFIIFRRIRKNNK